MRGDGADALDLVRADRDAEAGAADEQGAVGRAVGDEAGRVDGDVRVGGVLVGPDADVITSLTRSSAARLALIRSL